MKKGLLTILSLIFFTQLNAQSGKYRTGIFLHHSTGGCIWGPNGSNTSVPEEFEKFNSLQGFTGNDSFLMEENWYPGGDNEWATWHKIFEGEDGSDDISSILNTNKIVMIKSCFPSSNIYDDGAPADTNSPDSKTIYNYKWHWRHIINVMKNHPENFFIIWTNAPLVENATNSEEASRSNQFCTWAKDELAMGLDPEFGSFPPNVYVFDFFHKLADASGFLPISYASSTDDSHPNSDATALVAPQLVSEICNAAIKYENSLSSVSSGLLSGFSFKLNQNYPNPFNPATVISYQLPISSFINIKVYDILGNEVTTLINEEKPAGDYELQFNAHILASGVYYYRLVADTHIEVKKMILLK